MPACGTDMDEYGCTPLLVPVYDNGTAIRREGQVDVVESAGCAWETRSDRPWAPMLPSETDGLVRDENVQVITDESNSCPSLTALTHLRLVPAPGVVV